MHRVPHLRDGLIVAKVGYRAEPDPEGVHVTQAAGPTTPRILSSPKTPKPHKTNNIRMASNFTQFGIIKHSQIKAPNAPANRGVRH